MKDIINKYIRVLILLFYSSTYYIVTFAIYFNPSKQKPFNTFNSFIDAFYLALLMSSVYFILMLATYLVKRKMLFLILLFSTCIINLLFDIYLAIMVHQDYFTISFQILMCYFSIFIIRTGLISNDRMYIRTVAAFSFIVVAVFFVWVLLIGYALVIGKSLEIIEQIIYNIYNLILISILYYYTIKLYYKKFIVVAVKEKSVIVDDFDLSELLSEDIVMIIKLLVLGKPNCMDIHMYLLNNCKSYKNSDKKACSECGIMDYPISKCRIYKVIYNKVHYTKQILNLLKIGDLNTSLKSKNDYWKVTLFKDIKVFTE